MLRLYASLRRPAAETVQVMPINCGSLIWPRSHIHDVIHDHTQKRLLSTSPLSVRRDFEGRLESLREQSLVGGGEARLQAQVSFCVRRSSWPNDLYLWQRFGTRVESICMSRVLLFPACEGQVECPGAHFTSCGSWHVPRVRLPEEPVARSN